MIHGRVRSKGRLRGWGYGLVAPIAVLSAVVMGPAPVQHVNPMVRIRPLRLGSAAIAGGWKVVATPNLGAGSALNAVIPLSAADAWAVGDGVIDHWNGSEWRAVRGVHMPAGASWQLEGIAAVPRTSPRQLIAVGRRKYLEQPLVERWSGSAWAHMPAPEYELDAVAAVSRDDIWGIGPNSVIEHWNGSRWTVVHYDYNECEVLASISAVSAGAVYVAGLWSGSRECNDGQSTPACPLVERWSGWVWEDMSPPCSDVDVWGLLNGVVAVSGHDVWAVGHAEGADYGDAGSLIWHWDGQSWTSPNAPSPDPTADLVAVAASSPSSIWAAGGYYIAAPHRLPAWRSFVEHWNGSSWQIRPSRHPNQSDSLASIAAIPGTSRLWAVGQFAEEYSPNAWRTFATPVVPQLDNTLTAAAGVPGSGDLWAVGGAEAHFSPLIEEHVAPRWTVVPGPSAAGSLYGVSATSEHDAWAVGGGAGTALIEHWDGRRWKLLTGARFGDLLGVSARSPDDAWAAGSLSGQTLAEHWNGSSWTKTPTPKEGGEGSSAQLMAVDAVGSGDVWAVGYRDTLGNCSGGFPAYCYSALADHWNGKAWLVVPSPTPAGAVWSLLETLTATGPENVWAAGTWLSFDGTTHALLERWNGHHWRLAPEPSTICSVASIVMLPNGGVWAAGSGGGRGACTMEAGGGGPPYDPIVPGGPGAVVHWAGSRWSTSLPPSALPGVTIQALAVNRRGIWAVGSNATPYGVTQTLAVTHPLPDGAAVRRRDRRMPGRWRLHRHPHLSKGARATAH